MGVFSRLLPSITSAYALQTLLGAIFVPLASEKYYDLSGALGFLSTTAISLYYPSLRAKYWLRLPGATLPPIGSFAARQLVLSAALGVWTVRLGSYLAARAIKAGGDSRFDEVKHQPARFAFFWFAQATWITLVGLPVYLVNTLPAAHHPPLGRLDYVSLGFLFSSFALEVIADRQKSHWRARKDRKEHEEKFITSGLWDWSRHPNYLGEIGIWTSIWALSSSSIIHSPYFPRGTWMLAGLSPVVTYLLLRYVSGVPPLEKAGDKKFGNDAKWVEYKRTVPVLFPFGPKE
ncbi:hypothetical protein JAAARDRAFT_35830 [Jaapia argillacea MUCL 33604]|uniref:Steroid 5-alpha reductase C-terminal domain-containing protein n=1 Tax=Jaapia argillacea MUCL 33604 TaxID=933084 RepID=A0A067PTQ0_9AGAM|nr:hypothetical protein JAAARDRAFT_35830 [Jaapia argillacea MUCL 33604]